MQILRSVTAIRRFRRLCSGKVVLVPTMGALHAGHVSLIHRARKLAGKDGAVIVSIFVNPLQFGPGEDLSRYPRTWAEDRHQCSKARADAIFYPSVEAMYSPDASTTVDESVVSAGLCGCSRPGHFRGVTTVVLKLFNLCQPHVAVFGLKDFQQCRVIARMVRDLNVPTRLVFAPTLRERDGLAMSSRNTYLSPDERAQAPILREALLAMRQAYTSGIRDANKLIQIATTRIQSAPLARIDYITIVDSTSLLPSKRVRQGDTAALAVFFGHTRLIDNIKLL